MTQFLVHCRSKDLDQLTPGFNTNMVVNLDTTITKPEGDTHEFHLSLSSAEIPVTWYNISNNLNNSNLYVDGSASLAITPGNYDIYELVLAINADATFPYSAVYNVNTSKVTFTNTDSTEHTINYAGSESRGLSKALGFDRVDEVVSSGGTSVSDGCVNLQSVHTIFLHSNLGSRNVITTETMNITNIIEKIPVDQAPLDIIHFGSYLTSAFTTTLSGDSINSFTLELRDQSGVLLQLNSVNYELSLLFEVIEKPFHRREEPANSRRSVETSASLRLDRSIGAPLDGSITRSQPVTIPKIPVPKIPVRQQPVVINPVQSQSSFVKSELSDALLFSLTL